jgi:CysZ protein
MLTAFALACGDLFAKPQRGAILWSLISALLLLLALWIGATVLLHFLHFTGLSWLDSTIDIVGSLASLWLAWLLFPAMTAATMGFFLDGVARAVETRHYPGQEAPRRQSLGEITRSALRLALLALVLNLVALPFYLWPAINLLVYLGLNGYLVGREYFALVALRRVDEQAEKALWRRYRLRLILAGACIAFLLMLPIVNLVGPVLATAFIVHLFEGLRRDTLETSMRRT